MAKIHKGEGDQAYFLENIKHFVMEILGTKNEMLQSEGIAERIDAAGDGAVVSVCPVCGKEAIIKGSYLQCQDYGEACSFRISRYIARRYLSPEEAKELLARKRNEAPFRFQEKRRQEFFDGIALGERRSRQLRRFLQTFAPAEKTGTQKNTMNRKEGIRKIASRIPFLILA